MKLSESVCIPPIFIRRAVSSLRLLIYFKNIVTSQESCIGGKKKWT